VLAAFVAIVPLYAAGLLMSYLASRLTVALFYGQSLGTYDHYFDLFLPPQDILYSFVKVLVIAVLIILIHTYYGYRATGGPAGVGVAVGRSVRASLVLIFVFDIFVSLALWGSTTTVKIA
jgi:phospholipid/cholesterol/gamma-HCH transport system permease protein